MLCISNGHSHWPRLSPALLLVGIPRLMRKCTVELSDEYEWNRTLWAWGLPWTCLQPSATYSLLQGGDEWECLWGRELTPTLWQIHMETALLMRETQWCIVGLLDLTVFTRAAKWGRAGRELRQIRTRAGQISCDFYTQFVWLLGCVFQDFKVHCKRFAFYLHTSFYLKRKMKMTEF